MAKTEKIEKIFKKNCKKNLEVQKKLLPLQSQNRNAEVAQLVEHNLAKVGVASSSLVFRSKRSVRITVSTQDSQSCNRGSIPLPSTKVL